MIRNTTTLWSQHFLSALVRHRHFFICWRWKKYRNRFNQKRRTKPPSPTVDKTPPEAHYQLSGAECQQSRQRVGQSTKQPLSHPLISSLILIRPEQQQHPPHKAVLPGQNHSLIILTYWPLQYKGLPLELTLRRAHLKLRHWRPRGVPSSISVTAEQRGRGWTFIHALMLHSVLSGRGGMIQMSDGGTLWSGSDLIAE